MNTQLARRLLAAALGLGLLADFLFRPYQSRFGLALWGWTGLALALWFGREAVDTDARRDRQVSIAVAAGLLLLVLLRDAPMLLALNGFALVVTLLVVAWRAHGRPLATLEPRDALLGGLSAAASLAGGLPTLALRDAKAETLGESLRRNYKPFGIGALVAFPVLLLVASLLGEADPLFAAFVDRAGLFLDSQIGEHIGIVVASTWIAAGALRGSLVPMGVDGQRFRRVFDLPLASFLPALGGLTLLLTVWIGLQVRTMFGGAEYVASTAGVTVADYARRGFFELVVVAGIVLAALLVTDDLLARADAAARRSFAAVGGLLVALTGAMLVSALLRLALYLRYFGLTTDRVFALAILTWVGLVLAWCAATILRGNRARFAPGVLLISALWLGGLNLANPERWVVAVNVNRAAAGQEFDVAYHARLSYDAVPALRAAAARLDPAQGAALTAELNASLAARAPRFGDWRQWTLPYLRNGRQY